MVNENEKNPMGKIMNIANFNWKQMKYVQKFHRTLYALGFGQLIGRIILLLTTVGRKTGLKRVTPVQYEQIDHKYYLSSARGLQADWVRNIQCNPQVDVQVRSLRFQGEAEVVSDPARIADFIELRLQRHPVMLGAIMQKAHGLPKHPSRARVFGRHILPPLIPNLSLAAILAYLKSSNLLSFMSLFMPDLSWIARFSGGFAGIWIILRTGLILRVLRRYA